MKGSELVDLTLEQAKAAKWAAGREKYGPEWAGEDPFFEALSDATDVAVYLDEAEKRGHHVAGLQHMAHQLFFLLKLRCKGLER